MLFSYFRALLPNDMDKNYEQLYHNEEDHNWWFVSRRNMLMKLIDKYNIPKDAHILDIGCASGVFLSELQERGYKNLYALDYSAEAIEGVKKRGIPNAYVMDGHYPDFEEGKFDLIVSSDSLEHLEHDEVALKNWYKILKKGGLGFVLVPAFNFLWTHHDDINYHFRRYTTADLKEKTKKVGFNGLYWGYNYVLLFLPTALVRLVMKQTQKNKEAKEGQILQMPGWINKLLTALQNAENFFTKYIKFPFGVSAFVVVKK